MNFARLLAPALLAVFICGNAVAAPDFKDFRDWHAVCDNLRNCSAYGFDTEIAGNAYLRIERGGEANAPVRIVLAVGAEEGVTFSLRFDDASLPGLPDGVLTGKKGEEDGLRRIVLTGAVSADTLLASIRKAQKIVVTRQDPPGKKEPSDPKVSEISMSGAVAALLWIDEQQKRLDSVTALVKKGAKPASSVPQQPRAPVVSAAKPVSAPVPVKHSEALLEKGRSSCGEEDEGSKLEDVWALGGGRFLYAFTCPDSSGVYNHHYGLLIADKGGAGTVRPVQLVWPVKIGDIEIDPDRPSATNPVFDPKTMQLSTFSKGRGLGDCGSAEDWVWDGKSFRMTQLRMMPHCKGIPLDDWPVLYRAGRK